MLSRPPRLLTIAGSDSGGGAGVQADLKTFAAHETYGLSVITALTAQNTLGVQSVQGVAPEFVAAQLESVVDDVGCDAVKIGMLFSSQVVSVVAKEIKSWRERPPIVLDPVCVSTSGHSLLPESAVSTIKEQLAPLVTVITPNIPEAQLLASSATRVQSVDDMRACAASLASLGAEWVLLKGGHVPYEKEGTKVVGDLLFECRTGKQFLFERLYLDSKNTHGTGCTLSSALAARLAQGHSVPDAVKLAGDYVAGAIAASYNIGKGAGPVNHLFNLVTRPLPLPTQTSPTPFTDFLRNYDKDAWHRYTYHLFPVGLAAGTTPLACFMYFIKQDYHYLKHYARTNSLMAYKTEDLKEMEASTLIVSTVLKEMEKHASVCKKYGLSELELGQVEESVVNIAYNRFILDTCNKGDLLDCRDHRVATFACLLGYGEVGARLSKATEGVNRSHANPYWSWVEDYGQEWYQTAVRTGIELLEKTVADSPVSATRLEQLAKIFRQATLLEVAFWDAAMDAANS